MFHFISPTSKKAKRQKSSEDTKKIITTIIGCKHNLFSNFLPFLPVVTIQAMGQNEYEDKSELSCNKSQARHVHTCMFVIVFVRV